MQDTEILSTFQPSSPAAARSGAGPSVEVFDTCHVGLVLRAVLFVQLALAVGALFAADTALEWLSRLALLTAGALPATLVWLLVLCLLKTRLAVWRPAGQVVAGVALGALCGLYACAMLLWLVQWRPVAWLGGAAAGGVLAGILVSALQWRARGRLPADTAARFGELQARIRPHFLFNTLNSAIALVRAEPARAETLLEDLSDLFRQALAEPGEAVALAQEIDLAQKYLAIEQVRFGERLRVQWSLDPQAMDARVPPLLLQPLLENAVRHGVEPSEQGADVRVLTQRRGSRVVIKVINSSSGAGGAPGSGLALANVRARLDLLHDVQGQFQAVARDGVFQVRIEVPA
jgi:two-component system sensor histidine kinase AlgZ